MGIRSGLRGNACFMLYRRHKHAKGWCMAPTYVFINRKSLHMVVTLVLSKMHAFAIYLLFKKCFLDVKIRNEHLWREQT